MKKLQAILSLLLILTLLTGCTVSAAMEPEQQLSVTALTEPAPERLTAEEARTIALDDAGLTADAVTWLRSEFEIDDGIPEYEVEFRSGHQEYEYTIHAETGAIRARSREYDPRETVPPETLPPATIPPATAPPATEPPVQSDAAEKISADRAVSIALTHAGLSRTDVTCLEVEYDVDDGVPAYDVEFRYGKLEYSFEIHAETGRILEFDKDD